MLSSDEPIGRGLTVGHQVGETIFDMLSMNSPFAKLPKQPELELFWKSLKGSESWNLSNLVKASHYNANLCLVSNELFLTFQQMTSHPNNPDHNTVSYNLLAAVFHARKEFEQEGACLGAVILNHPLLPDLWVRLGRSYVEMASDEKKSTDVSRLRRLSAASFARCKLLLKSVERSVTDFVKDKNLAQQGRIERELESLNIEREMLDKIFELVSKHLKSDDLADDEPAPAEFEDLGKSVRMKAIEESFRKLDSEEVDLASIHLPSLTNFEQKMFPFIDEINWNIAN